MAIPAGYHNGSGYVSGSGAYNKGVSDADARANPNSTNYTSGYNAGVTAADGRTNVDSANYKGGYSAGVSATKKGNAGTGDVLSGKTFTNASSVNATGTMPNKGGTTQDAAVTQDNTYTYLTVPANGYYNTSSKLRAKNSNLLGEIQQKNFTLVSFDGTMHSVKNDKNVVASNNNTAYCLVKGTATIIIRIAQMERLKYLESYQPDTNANAGIGGASTFVLYGSNDNVNWEEIPTWIACARGTEGGWYNEATTVHVVRNGDGNYNAKQWQYYKLVMKSVREWLCVGMQRLFF